MNQPICLSEYQQVTLAKYVSHVSQWALVLALAMFTSISLSQQAIAQAQPVTEAKLLIPVAQRYLEPAVKADLARIAELQAHLASKRTTQARDNDYVWVKAQRWLDVAQDEYRNNNRGVVPSLALLEAHRLSSLVDSTNGIAQAWLTPLLDNTPMIRPDLWSQIQVLKDKSRALDTNISSLAKCALGSLAYAEVQLSWAAWISNHYGWRSALPYTSHAERKIQQAVSQYKTCEGSVQVTTTVPMKGVANATTAEVFAAPTSPSPVVVPLVANSLSAAPAPALAAAQPSMTTPNLIVPSKIHFAHSQKTLNLDAQATLRLAGKVLAQYPALPIVIQGYADDTGSLERNKRLSLERAIAVKAYLQTQGITPDRIQVLGLGTVASDSVNRQARIVNPAHRRAQIQIATSLEHPIRQQLLFMDTKEVLLCGKRQACKP